MMELQSFEDRLQALEGIVRELEEGELPLEDSLARYEAGVGLVRGLRDELQRARLRVGLLQDDGTVQPEPELAPP